METLTSDQWNRLGQLYVQHKLNKAGSELVEQEIQRNPDYRNYIREEQSMYEALMEMEEQLRWDAISTRANELRNVQIKDSVRPTVRDYWLVRTERIHNTSDQGKSKLRIRLKPSSVLILLLLASTVLWWLYVIPKSSRKLTIYTQLPVFYPKSGGLSFDENSSPNAMLPVKIQSNHLINESHEKTFYVFRNDTLTLFVANPSINVLIKWKILFNPYNQRYTLLQDGHKPVELIKTTSIPLPLP